MLLLIHRSHLALIGLVNALHLETSDGLSTGASRKWTLAHQHLFILHVVLVAEVLGTAEVPLATQVDFRKRELGARRTNR